MNKRIVIIDDEPTVVAFCKKRLEQVGYVVETARNGKEGLKIINDYHVDLVVTDVIMPVMDGVDLYKELKKHERTKDIPIVIITDNQVFKDSFSALGVQHFVPKPLDANTLIEKVGSLFVSDGKSKQSQILVFGTDKNADSDLAEVLIKDGCIVGIGRDPIDFMSNALILQPKVILIDIMINEDDITAKELVKAFKCFRRLKDVVILLYTHSAPEQMGDITLLQQIQAEKDNCLGAGATEYIGRYNRTIFIDEIRKYLSSTYVG